VRLSKEDGSGPMIPGVSRAELIPLVRPSRFPSKSRGCEGASHAIRESLPCEHFFLGLDGS
jgi:hypothetical protein